MPHAAIIALRNQQDRLLAAVEVWARLLRDNARQTRDPSLARAPLLLPLLKGRQLLREGPIDLRAALAAFPQVFYRCGLPDDRAKIDRHLARVVMQGFGVNAALQSRLSEIACEAASHRVLLTAQDELDVTVLSTLTAAAFANLGWILADVDEPRPLTPQEQRLVLLPFEWAELGRERMRPGDLWVMDLLAQSALYAFNRWRGQESTEFLRAATVRLIAGSLLCKLLEVNRFGKELAAQANYQSWPGLATLLAQKGAASLQMAVCGELALALHHDTTGLSALAFFRFLDALMALGDAVQVLIGQRLAAQLLCELLVLDEMILDKLRRDAQASQPLLKAIAWIEHGAKGGHAAAKVEYVRLRIARDCLYTYAAYCSIADTYAVHNPWNRISPVEEEKESVDLTV